MRGPVSYEATKEGVSKRRQDHDDTSNLDSWHVIRYFYKYCQYALINFSMKRVEILSFYLVNRERVHRQIPGISFACFRNITILIKRVEKYQAVGRWDQHWFTLLLHNSSIRIKAKALKLRHSDDRSDERNGRTRTADNTDTFDGTSRDSVNTLIKCSEMRAWIRIARIVATPS